MIIAVNFPIKAIGKKKPEKKIRASTGFEPVTSAIPVRCSGRYKGGLPFVLKMVQKCLEMTGAGGIIPL